MKKKIKTIERGKEAEKEIDFIPFRYILAIILAIFETLCVIATVILLTVFVPYFYIIVVLTQFIVAIAIINRNDNPDYKLPWLFFDMLIPIAGFMLYFMFYSRKLSKKQIKRLERLKAQCIPKDDYADIERIRGENAVAGAQAVLLNKLADSHLYCGTDIKYYPLGERLFDAMLEDLNKAEKFIFMEYFIIEDGLFWDSVLNILKAKAAAGVDVRVVYDDIGCMTTLPGNYYKQLRKMGIEAVPFARLRGQANNEFNNRSHRKITVIDGKVGFTGGVNIADEYINRKSKFGHWKDAGIRLEGEAVNEFTRLFLTDYGISCKQVDDDFSDFYVSSDISGEGYCIPFGDGPKPIYDEHVSESVILNMLNQAEKYVYITTPYLIIDNELVKSLENAAKRGIDVRIITPHIPDKKLVFLMTRSHYPRLIAAGVKIYEYKRGFVHAKTYISDDSTAVVGTINMDYRSLVHHFENGVWIYGHSVIKDIKSDFLATQAESLEIESKMTEENPFRRFVRAMVKVFSPLL